MALDCVLTSVRGNRGKNYENEPLVPQKHTKKKKEKRKRAWEHAGKTSAKEKESAGRPNSPFSLSLPLHTGRPVPAAKAARQE
jgi:hypothetical protein